jgi:voltage-gated sodium channel
MLKIVKSMSFDMVVGIALILNCAQIGAETFHARGEQPALLALLENFFVAFFVFEIAMRVAGHTWVWFFDLWNFIDAILILVTGVLALWILKPFNVDPGLIASMGCLRILRLVRVLRTVRILPLFQDAWLLVQGVLNSGLLLAWAYILLFFFHFIFAIAIVDTFSKADTFQDDENVQTFFPNLQASMFTLFQTMTCDSWGDKVIPIVLEKPLLGGAVFGLFIGVCGIVIFNLLTAVVVFKAIDARDNDTEMIAFRIKLQYCQMRAELYKIFQEVDEDGSGKLTKEEFLDVLDDVAFIRKMKQLDIDLVELPEIFGILDDGDGVLTAEEFISGLMKMHGPCQSKDMLKATRTMMKCQGRGGECLNRLDDMYDSEMDMIQEVLGGARRNLLEAQIMTAEIFSALDNIGVNQVFKGTLTQAPLEVAMPDVNELVKKEKAARRRQEESMSTAAAEKLKKGAELPPQTFVMQFFEDKQSNSLKRSRTDEPQRPPEEETLAVHDVVGVAEGETTMEQARIQEPNALNGLLPRAKTAGSSRTPWIADQLRDAHSAPARCEAEPETGVAGEMQLQWDGLRLGAARWQKSELRDAATAGEELLKPTLTVQALHPTFAPSTPDSVSRPSTGARTDKPASTDQRRPSTAQSIISSKKSNRSRLSSANSDVRKCLSTCIEEPPTLPNSVV